MPKFTLHTFLSISIICLLLSTSCGPKKVTPQSQLHDSVMVIHDEVMPKMKDIYRLRKGLKKKAKEIEAPSEIAQINTLIGSLEEADDAMMEWMSEYDEPNEGDTGAMEYLAAEKVKIEAVRNVMLSAIEKTQKVLDAQ